MKTLKFLVLVLIAVPIVFNSCKKDNSEDLSLTPPQPYYALEVGNYWIYQEAYFDSAWNRLNDFTIDSVFVEKDTLINGKLFYILKEEGSLGQKDRYWIREDGEELINSNDEVFLSPNWVGDTIRTDTIEYTIAKVWLKEENNFQTPAGTFDCLDLRGELYFWDNTGRYDHFDVYHNYYGKGVGVVKKVVPSTTSNKIRIVKELIRYNIQ